MRASCAAVRIKYLYPVLCPSVTSQVLIGNAIDPWGAVAGRSRARPFWKSPLDNGAARTYALRNLLKSPSRRKEFSPGRNNRFVQVKHGTRPRGSQGTRI